MRIAIDARMMGAGSTRGIGRYIEELIRHLLEISDDTYILFVREPEQCIFKDHDRVELIKADIPWYGWKEQLSYGRLLKKAKADLYHFPHWNVPWFFNRPFVMTVHDLILLHHPMSAKITTRSKWMANIKYALFKKLLRRNLTKAKGILTPTYFVQEDLERRFSKTQGKITVTSEGITAFPEETPNYPTTETRFLFYVGSAYPHKRLDLLLTAWEEVMGLDPSLQLIIAGEKDVFMQRHMQEAKNRALARVHFVGKISDQSLASYLRHALAFIFPSSDEGFGLPPLEALSLGCPVVSSDSSCLKEVLPEHGVLFFKDGDADDMIHAIETVVQHQVEFREQVKSMYTDLMQRFSWENTAEITHAEYQRLGLHDQTPSTESRESTA